MIDLERNERFPLAQAMFVQLALACAYTAVGAALTLFAHVVWY